MLFFFIGVALASSGHPSPTNPSAGGAWDDGSVMFYNGKCETYMQTGNVHWGISPDECRNMTVLDKKLNATYRRRMASLNRGAKAQLKTSQRQWIALRNSTCGLEEPVSIVDEWAASCFIEETKKRVSFLENHGDR